ncbi:WXG100 family type VII secretion target [Phytoactinopolyspora limicola]|uniref:WXG100 family type VII secretion target n=1 Tax=Phytoactinopolyspora limicola TaxID=2715536 RepID=UPI00140B5D3C|nr:WXG100 family type VII secretion target [Phytoactinopolyspora limicola]
MAVGAELPTLQELHRTFNAKAEDADGIKNDVDSALGNSVWTGAYSQQFRDAWDEYKQNLVTLRDALESAAEDVRINHNNIAEATGESDRI